MDFYGCCAVKAGRDRFEGSCPGASGLPCGFPYLGSHQEVTPAGLQKTKRGSVCLRTLTEAMQHLGGP